MSTRTSGISSYYQEVAQDLQASGYSPAATEALMQFDATMFKMMRRMVKGELPAQLMAELGIGLEMAQFQTLTAVMRIHSGMGRDAPAEATIGLVADELKVDPSRASRVVADLIAKGYLRRDVSQSDGRKAVLHTTETARVLFDKFRRLKWQKAMQVFADWSEDDILCFSRLFSRYNTAMRAAYPPRD
jgi:DNA-binding MarR family transcriptional regulator